MSDSMVRASEIAEYVYCRRAWWLSRVAGYRADNVERLEGGTGYHQAHEGQVRRAVFGRRLAYLLVFAAVSIFVFLLIRGV